MSRKKRLSKKAMLKLEHAGVVTVKKQKAWISGEKKGERRYKKIEADAVRKIAKQYGLKTTLVGQETLKKRINQVRNIKRLVDGRVFTVEQAIKELKQTGLKVTPRLENYLKRKI